MAVHGESLPTGVAHTSPGDTRLTAMLSDFSNVWNSCEVASRKPTCKMTSLASVGHMENRCGLCVNAQNASLPS